MKNTEKMPKYFKIYSKNNQLENKIIYQILLRKKKFYLKIFNYLSIKLGNLYKNLKLKIFIKQDKEK